MRSRKEPSTTSAGNSGSSSEDDGYEFLDACCHSAESRSSFDAVADAAAEAATDSEGGRSGELWVGV